MTFRSASHCCNSSGAELRHVIPISEPKFISKNSASVCSGLDFNVSNIFAPKKQHNNNFDTIYSNKLTTTIVYYIFIYIMFRNGRLLTIYFLLLHSQSIYGFVHFQLGLRHHRFQLQKSCNLEKPKLNEYIFEQRTSRTSIRANIAEEFQDFTLLDRWAEENGIVRDGWDIAYLPTYQTRGSY